MKLRICFHLILIQREVLIFHIAMRFLSEHCSVVCQDTSLPCFTHATEARDEITCEASIFFSFGYVHMVLGILVTRPGIKPMPPAMGSRES